jgi:hypothetical protein
VAGQPTQTHIVGTVTSGLFKGRHVDVRVAFTPKTGNCVNSNLVSVTFKNNTPLKIS